MLLLSCPYSGAERRKLPAQAVEGCEHASNHDPTAKLTQRIDLEREVTGERIRDKIAASKKKGMWMGGMPPLGYDVKKPQACRQRRRGPHRCRDLPALSRAQVGSRALGRACRRRNQEQAPHAARRRRIWGSEVLPWGALSDLSEPALPRRDTHTKAIPILENTRRLSPSRCGTMSRPCWPQTGWSGQRERAQATPAC
jgi:hypothetical protein